MAVSGSDRRRSGSTSRCAIISETEVDTDKENRRPRRQTTSTYDDRANPDLCDVLATRTRDVNAANPTHRVEAAVVAPVGQVGTAASVRRWKCIRGSERPSWLAESVPIAPWRRADRGVGMVTGRPPMQFMLGGTPPGTLRRPAGRPASVSSASASPPPVFGGAHGRAKTRRSGPALLAGPVRKLNQSYAEMAADTDSVYVDRWPALADGHTLRKEFTRDDLHLLAPGYRPGSASSGAISPARP